MAGERAARKQNLLGRGNFVYSDHVIRGLIISARILLTRAAAESTTETRNNFLTMHGPAAIVISVTALEAFVNQVLFACLFTRPNVRTQLEKIVDADLLKKISRIPKLVSGRKVTYTELKLVQHVRHEIVHYFPKRGFPDIPACLRPLTTKDLLVSKGDGKTGDIGWEDKMQSFQLAKWSGATIARSAEDFASALLDPAKVTTLTANASGTAQYFRDLVI